MLVEHPGVAAFKSEGNIQVLGVQLRVMCMDRFMTYCRAARYWEDCLKYSCCIFSKVKVKIGFNSHMLLGAVGFWRSAHYLTQDVHRCNKTICFSVVDYITLL